jgi:tetratricopeptide (TPR) repeat protein
MSGVARVLAVGVFVSLAAARPPAKGPADPPVEQLVAELGDDDFATREAAQRELWKRGAAAIPALEKAANDPDPEVARRARDLLDKFSWGILPDTPPDVLKLIARFQGGSAGERQAVLVELLGKGKPGRAVVRAVLAKDIPAETRRPVLAHLDALLRREVPVMMFDGRADDAADLISLHAAGTTPEGAADYAAFRVLQNTLPAATADAEAAAKTARNPAAARMVLAHLYRADRQWAKARAAAADYPAAAEEGVGTAVERLHEEEGNWAALRDAKHPRANMPEALHLSLLRLAGDEKEFEAAAGRVKADADGSGSRDLVRDAAFALLLNNKAPDATDLLVRNRSNLGLLSEVLIAQMRFKDALELLGPGKNDAVPAGEQLEFNLRRARLLVLTGRRDEGVQLFAQVAEGFRAPQPDNPQDAAAVPMSRRSILRSEMRVGLRDLAGEHAALFLTADGQTGPDRREGESVFEVLFGLDATAAETLYWALRAKKIPGDAAGGTMKRVRELLAGTAPPAAVDEALKALGEAEIAPRVPPVPAAPQGGPAADEVGRIHQLAATAAVCRAAKRDAEAETALVAAAELATDRPGVSGPRSWVFGLSDASRPWLELGDFLSDRGRFRDAAAKFEAGWRRFPDQPLLLFLSGKALRKAGDEKEGRRRTELSHWVSLGSERVRGRFLDELVRRGEGAAAKRETDLLLRACWARDHHYGNVINQAARASALTKDFATAGACVQRSLLVLMRTPELYFVELSAYLTVPHDMLIFRARALLAAGKVDEAMVRARACLKVTPGHIDLVCGMVPELEKRGRKAEADELFAAAWGAYRKMLADYPDSPAARGALATLAAHCRRERDRGLAYAKEAVKADPLSPGFREALAELHFAGGDRDAALAVMTKLADEHPRSRLYRRQLARYKTAAFDSPWPDTEE